MSRGLFKETVKGSTCMPIALCEETVKTSTCIGNPMVTQPGGGRGVVDRSTKGTTMPLFTGIDGENSLKSVRDY